jgi:predicted Zn-dependent peptidase
MAMQDEQHRLLQHYSRGFIRGKLVTPEEDLAAILAVTRADIIAAAQSTQLQAVYFLAGDKSSEEATA